MQFHRYPDQQLLLPAPQEWLPEDHPAYFISGVVDLLDLPDIASRYEREETMGIAVAVCRTIRVCEA